MDIWNSTTGILAVEVESADPTAILSAFHREGLELYDISLEDPLRLRFCLRRKDYPSLKQICRKRSVVCRVVRKAGIYWLLRGLLGRPVLIVGILLMLAAALIIPSRVFFIRVEGNSLVPERKILEEAASCGIGFGASRREVRSEKMKNALLSALPQLQWAGINTEGCTAVITVRERETVQSQETRHGVSRIVAARDGVIASVTVTRGTGLVTPGQAVTAGETLISGYTDCGLIVRAERAEGEIYALTERNLEAVTPLEWVIRREETASVKKYGVIFGKKRINFYQDSGILGGTCVRIYEEKTVTLPGGFVLPIRFFVETWTSFETTVEMTEEAETAKYLSAFSESYLNGSMAAGRILSRSERLVTADGLLRLSGKYACLEMIGQERSEETEKIPWTDKQNESSAPTG